MKKPMSLKGFLIPSISCATLSIILVVGTAVAYNFENLLDVYFSDSEYEATDNEKEVCESVVKEGAVLLENKENALPLKANERKVALFGQDSVDFVYGGSGSGSVDTSLAPTLKQAFENVGFEVNSTLWNFYTTGNGKNYRKQTPDEAGHGDFAINEVPLSEYGSDVISSLNDDFAVCVIGRSGGESADLPLGNMASGYKYLEIDKNEQDMIKLACEHYSKVILLVNANNPMELGFLNDEAYKNVKSALWIGGVGQEGLYAIPKLLSGEDNPSGRLVDTYAYDSTSAPSYQNMGDFTITNSSQTNGTKYLVYGEGIYVGYRYYETRYEDVVLGNTTGFDYSKTVQYPFGYGKSYTSFEYKDFKVTETSDKKGFEIEVTVKNTGDYTGKDVVEFYVQKPYTKNGVETASIELIDFKKTALLKSDKEEKISVIVSKEDLTSYDANNARTYILDKGDYYFAVGTNSHDALNNILAAKGKTTSNNMTYNGNANLAKKALTVDTIDATTYSTSSVTGNKITNAFDDCDVNYYEDYTYLSRSDWNNTFPTAFKNRSWEATAKMINDLKFYDVNTDTTDDAVINSFTYKTNSTDTTYQLKDLIGVSLTDSKWDDIVNQLSYVQMTKLIRLGGYSTVQIDRIGLPATVDKDGPSGISGTLVGGTSCMAWPAEVVMASTWNTALIQTLGEYFGEDSIVAGVAGVYGPGADIHRSPYSGRNFEYFSEDATLSSKMAASEMTGLRSKGVIAYIKHYALNDQETNRYGGAIFANEQTIREISLKGFEGAVVDGKATAMMCAMNRIGARWVGAHKGAMSQVLRDEWGYTGFVITDQASVPSMFYQDMISGLWAGTDMWLNTSSTYWSLDNYKTDKTMQYYIHRSAKNILYSITNSWVIDESFKTSTTGEALQTTVNIFPWRETLMGVDITVWAISFVTIGVLTTLFILSRKKKEN